MFKKIIFLLILLPYIALAEKKDTGKIKMRARMEYSEEKSRNNLKPNISSNIQKPLSNGTGLNISAAYFFSEKIASEVTFGINRFKLCNAANIASIYGGTEYDAQRKTSYSVPFSLGFQLYPVKLNNINLYTGGGYYYSWTSNNKYADFRNFSGHFAQIGLDIYNKHNIGLNFDIKKYKRSSKIRYKTPSISNIKLNNKINSSPWVFSSGVFFEF